MSRLNVDCLVLVFNELRDKNSLYSCLLVNREWCHLVVPILWNNFSWCNVDEDESIFFDTILSLLPSTSRQFLSDNYIKLPSSIILKPPLFNYISFCKFPEADAIKRITEMVLDFNSYDKRKRNLLEQEIYKLFISQCKNVKELSWINSQPLSQFPGASTCFSQLHSLFIDLDYVNSNALHQMSNICRCLNTLIIYNCSQDLLELVFLIDSQRNLKNVNIYSNNNRRGNYKKLSKALAGKSNMIKHLHLNLNAKPSLSLVDLTDLSIFDCYSLNETREFQHYLSILKFPDLQSLYVTGSIYSYDLATLVQKTNGNILRAFFCGSNKEDVGILIDAIAKNCRKIEILHISLCPTKFKHMVLLLNNCRNLVELNLSNDSVYLNYNAGNDLLNILAEYSPKSLTNITISYIWNFSPNVLERFFESFRKQPLFYFHVKDSYYFEDIYKIKVRKFIDEGVVKYSNICSYS
ncbi:hypothetical protein RclHR1_05340009 [Rhizophagus clarus]|uniref:F-box domain-containing protein n=1 Tax=Rhizophagus clarus TaxID=94130 RepID=A0A2Z6RSK7_9GLOM|nr:hypothetical protein RclHR1_05340009 [Rhizophagus clarus]GES82155.1 hypothetical protein GLOIN_2v1735159 [Rhizophagus clarus]